jgi:hypothetical protein
MRKGTRKKWFEFICNSRTDKKGNPFVDIVVDGGYSQKAVEKKVREVYPHYRIEKINELEVKREKR